MAKKITIPYNGKTYTLEYTRESARTMEKQGFKIGSISDMPLTMITALFNGAFLVNHSGCKAETKEKIYDSLKNRSKLVQTLSEMYADTYNTLLDPEEDDGNEGNAGWEVAE